MSTVRELVRNDPFDILNLRIPAFGSAFNTPFFHGFDSNEGNLALDVSENADGQVVVRAPLPGFKKEDIDVQINNGVLSIKAERKEEKETKNEKYYRKECSWGSVSRAVSLPGIVASDKVNAELKDGVLELRIPQAESARPKKIVIK